MLFIGGLVKVCRLKAADGVTRLKAAERITPLTDQVGPSYLTVLII